MAFKWTDASDGEIDGAIRLVFMRLGYQEVKTEQLEAVRGVVKGKDVFVSLPTGSGKSVCYGFHFVFDYLRRNDTTHPCP